MEVPLWRSRFFRSFNFKFFRNNSQKKKTKIRISTLKFGSIIWNSWGSYHIVSSDLTSSIVLQAMEIFVLGYWTTFSFRLFSKQSFLRIIFFRVAKNFSTLSVPICQYQIRIPYYQYLITYLNPEIWEFHLKQLEELWRRTYQFLGVSIPSFSGTIFKKTKNRI